MAKYSIKTVDGGRLDFTLPEHNHEIVFDLKTNFTQWLEVPVSGGTKYINVRNIVSVTVTEEEAE